MNSKIGSFGAEAFTLPAIDIQIFRIISSIQRGDSERYERLSTRLAQSRKVKAVELAWHHQRMGIVQRMNGRRIGGRRRSASRATRTRGRILFANGAHALRPRLRSADIANGDVQP